ncbi:chemotaxis protein CheW [Ferrovibrio sp.]|uniref:chemotaxis protein CheW n=1 Tax=Ferrovibrio sp. TaxID=1917215 RepID=UPI003D0F1065
MADQIQPSDTVTFDWQRVRERLDRALRRIEDQAAPTPEQVNEILRKRAATYAKRIEIETVEHMDVIAFTCGDERYAVPLNDSTAAATLGKLTPIPGLPTLYLGLLSSRGAIYPVIDPRPLLSDRQPLAGDFKHAVLVSNAAGSIGLAVSELYGVERYRVDQIARMVEGSESHQAIRGMGPGNTIIVDPTRLLLDIRLTIDEQPMVTASGAEGE